MIPKGVTIARFLRTGELDPATRTLDSLLEQAGRLLDKCNSYDILGEVVFEGSDGKLYGVWVEAEVGELNPAYAAEVLEELEDDKLSDLGDK